MKKTLIIPLVTIIVCLSAPQCASAYVGPGSGIAVIGAALAFVAGVLLAIVGFVWYPLKRLWRRVSKVDKTESAQLDRHGN